MGAGGRNTCGVTPLLRGGQSVRPCFSELRLSHMDLSSPWCLHTVLPSASCLPAEGIAPPWASSGVPSTWKYWRRERAAVASRGDRAHLPNCQ